MAGALAMLAATSITHATYAAPFHYTRFMLACFLSDTGIITLPVACVQLPRLSGQCFCVDAVDGTNLCKRQAVSALQNAQPRLHMSHIGLHSWAYTFSNAEHTCVYDRMPARACIRDKCSVLAAYRHM